MNFDNESKKILEILLKGMGRKNAGDDEMFKHGKNMFDLYITEGLPPEVFIDELKKKIEIKRENLILIVSEYLNLKEEHRLKSGGYNGQDKKKKIQEKNMKILRKLYKSGNFETI